RPLLALLVVVSAASIAACGSEKTPSDGKFRVVATIAPIGALAQAVGGEAIQLDVLVKAGVDPHEFDLKAADARRLANAQVILRNGLGIDAFLDKSLKGNKATVFTLTDGLTLREAPAEGGGTRQSKDPHVWHDPRNDIAMVDAIVKALSAAAPDQAATFEANGKAYQERLRQVDREVQGIIDAIPPANRKMVTDHDAVGYFAARYGITIVGTVIPGTSTVAEPSAADIAALVETIRREGVRAIFAESSVDPKVARRVAEETGVKIVDDLFADSLGSAGTGADTVDGMLLSNARKIADALK
ncbi:MAG: zinc ABC transporter substrate-binding protein, partial [Dehalococcoidia bacterium]